MYWKEILHFLSLPLLVVVKARTNVPRMVK